MMLDGMKYQMCSSKFKWLLSNILSKIRHVCDSFQKCSLDISNPQVTLTDAQMAKHQASWFDCLADKNISEALMWYFMMHADQMCFAQL